MMMRSSLPGLFLLLLLSSSSLVPGLGSVLQKATWHVLEGSTWQDAQTFCRSSDSDLIVVSEQLDLNSIALDKYKAWIGLRKDDDKWVWPDGHDLDWNSDFWPHNYHPRSVEGCAYVNYDENRFGGTDCSEHNFFICNKGDDGDKYTFINRSMTWSDAQDFCQSPYKGLAVIKDDKHLTSAVSQQDFPVWTGLYRDEETWKWSTGVSDYRNWAPNEPGPDGDCVAIYSVSHTMITQNCSTRYPFLCFKDNLLVVKQNKSWEEALEYCRAFKAPNRGPYQLVSVQPGDDYSYMMNRVMEADTDEVWTGLRYLAGSWFWANRAGMLLPDLPRCPTGQHCGVFSKNSNGSLETRDCLEQKNFLCYSQW